MNLDLVLNGVRRSLEIDPGESLMDLLRRSGCKSVKNGCDDGYCGACAVLLDGRAVNACLVFAAAAAGRRVDTLEGLAREGALHTVQRVMLDLGAVQCGFCTPGIVMTALDLLGRNPGPRARSAGRWPATTADAPVTSRRWRPSSPPPPRCGRSPSDRDVAGGRHQRAQGGRPARSPAAPSSRATSTSRTPAHRPAHQPAPHAYPHIDRAPPPASRGGAGAHPRENPSCFHHRCGYPEPSPTTLACSTPRCASWRLAGRLPSPGPGGRPEPHRRGLRGARLLS
jgi:carbon-monoxide dehydrogenase small subunit